LFFVFLFYGDWNSFRREEEKEKLFCLFLVFCDAGQRVRWWLSILFVVAGEVTAAMRKK
jgi:hypothetical protein